MKENNKIKIGITIGDMNGVGPEIILKSFLDKRMLDFCTPIIYASSKSLDFFNNHFIDKEISNYIYTFINL